MKRKYKIVLVCILTGGIAFVAYLSTEIYLSRAADAKADIFAERIDSGEEISSEEMRIMAESLLRRRFSQEHHDAAVVLIEHGNSKSVPDLIRALRWYPPGSNLCQTDHILEALRKITGKDFGDTAREWKHWNETTNKSPSTEWAGAHSASVLSTFAGKI